MNQQFPSSPIDFPSSSSFNDGMSSTTSTAGPSTFRTRFAVDEPVEIRFARRATPTVASTVLSAAVAPNGLIVYSLTSATGGAAESLSNLQMAVPYPRKAVPGWQAELVRAAATAVQQILEVR